MSNALSLSIVLPFQGQTSLGTATQGGAARLCRFALPWALLLRPFRSNALVTKHGCSNTPAINGFSTARRKLGIELFDDWFKQRILSAD